MEEKQILGIGSRVKHIKFGVGVIIKVMPAKYRITFFQHGSMNMHIDTELEVIEANAPDQDLISLDDVEKVVSGLLENWGGLQEIVPLGDRWEGGTLILKPGNDTNKSKEMPIEKFFHKIVMVRDKLRVMEQRINSSKLTDEEKVNLQQYITRIYGSLTTFNVLFKYKDDHFKGSSR